MGNPTTASRPIHGGSTPAGQAARRIGATVLLASIAVALMAVLLYQTVYVPFRKLERERAIQAMAQIEAGLDGQLQRLATLSRDWGIWDDAYRFMVSRDREFVSTNFTAAGFEGAGLTLVCIADTDGTVAAGMAYDLKERKEISISPFSSDRLEGELRRLLVFPTLQATHSGLFMSERGPILVVSNPILTSQGEGPIRGAMIMGRLLDQTLLKDLSRSAGLELRVVPLDSGPSAGNDGFQFVSRNQKRYGLSEATKGMLIIRAELADFDGRPVMALEGTVPRDLSGAGTSALLLSLTGLVLLVTVLVVTTSRLQRRNNTAGPLEEVAGKRLGRSARPEWGIALWMVLAGLVLSLAAAYAVGVEESERRREMFNRKAEMLSHALQHQRFDQIARIEGVARFFMAAEAVTREEFRNYCSPMLPLPGAVRALEWAPRVSLEERATWTPDRNLGTFATSRITELTQDGALISAAERPEYFPLAYVEPVFGNEQSVGYDLGSDPERRTALEKARDTGRPIATAPTLLSRETGTPAEFLVCLPLYQGGQIPTTTEGRREKFAGCVVGVFRAGEFVKSAIEEHEIEDLAFSLRDVSESGDTRLLYESGKAAGSALARKEGFECAGRWWEVSTEPTPAFLQQHPLWISWAVLALGTLLTLIAAFLAVADARRRRFLESFLSKVAVEELRQSIRFRRRILAPSALAMLLSLTAFAGWFQIYCHRDEIARTLAATKQAGKMWTGLIGREAAIMKDQLDIIEELPQLAESLHSRNREELFGLLEPQLLRLRKTYGINYLHVILPDATCLLRVHDPQRHGDVLERPTAREAIHTRQETWGADLGPLGTYTLRALRPVWLQGDLVGFVELGKPLESLAENVHAGLGVDLLVVFPKHLTTQEKFEAGRKITGLFGDWNRFDDFVVVKQTIAAIPGDLSRHVRGALGGGASGVFRLASKDGLWSCQVLPSNDAEGNIVAHLVVMRNIVASQALRTQVFVAALLSMGALSVLLYMALASIVTKVEQRLIKAVAGREREAAARRGTEEHLAATLRSIGDGVISTDLEGCVTEMNPTAARLTGWTQGEARGRPLEEVFRIVHSQTRAAAENPVTQVLKEGHGAELPDHTALIRRDGTELRIADSAAPIWSAGGELQGAVLVFRDVTEESRMREVLKQSEDFQRMLLDNIAVGVVVIDPATHLIEHANTMAAAMFGAPLEAITGRICHQYLCPAEQGACPITDLGKQIESAERVMVCADGSHRDTLKSVRRMVVQGQEKLIESFVDITERKHAEEELRKLSRAVEQSSASIVITDLNGAIEYVNPKFTEVTGYTREEALGQNPRILKSGDLSPESYRELWETISSGGEWRGEFNNRRKTGELFWEQASISPVRDAAGVIRHFVAVKEDITQRKQAEEALRQSKAALIQTNDQLEQAIRRANEMALQAEMASEAKSQFLANMSHEIRTPMSGVLGMIELMLKTDLDERQRRRAEMAYFSAESLLKVLNDILDLSKIEADKLELDPQPMDLRAIAEEVAQLLWPQASSKNVEVIVNYRPNTPHWFVGDALRIRQILTNLAGNAVKFTSRGHVLIAVRCEVLDEGVASVCLSVRDTGVGIPKAAQERLFQPFVQVDGSVTRKFGGTGLGLSICRRLVELMNGRIWVESEPGQGSVFHCTFTLPLLGSAAAPVRVSPAELRGVRALVVDDNPISCAVLSDTLEDWGLHPISAKSGRAALDGLTQRGAAPIDLIIVNACLPETDGFDLMERLANQPASSIPPVVLLGSGGYEQRAAHNQAAGLSSCLIKPVRQTDLQNALLVAMGQRLPLLRTASSSARQDDQGRTLRVLLAEDNPVNQEVASELLKAMGHQVQLASNGRLAVQAARENGFDLILMDVQMPEMGGFEATREIRGLEQHNGRHTPIIAMTAHALRQDHQQCLDEGMDDYLSKPISGVRLAEVLSRWSAGRQPQHGALAPEGPAHLARATPDSDAARDHAGADDEPTVIDLSDLLTRCVGRASIALRVVAAFGETTPAVMANLEQSLHLDDLKQAARHAHALRGAAANLSALALSQAAAAVESCCREGDKAAAGTHLEAMESHLALCLQALPAIRQTLEESR